MTKARLMHGASRLARFGREDDGAVAIWFSMLLVPILGFTFGAIKYTELSEQRTNMTDAMDASALAMARWIDFNNKDACQVATGNRPQDRKDNEEVKRYAKEFFDKNYPLADTLFADKKLSVPFKPGDHLDFDLTCSKITVKADAFKDMGGVLSHYFGLGSVALGAKSEITLAGAGRVEIALVLDLSGSMSKNLVDENGQEIEEKDEKGEDISGTTVTRLEGLKLAVDGMLDELYGETTDAKNEFARVGVVPFNSIVNVGKTLANENLDWFDEGAEGYWHGSDFIHVQDGSGAKGSRAEENQVTARQVNHFDLFDSVPGEAWEGCVEALPFPLDELTVVPGKPLKNDDYDTARVKPGPPTEDDPNGFTVNPKASSSTKDRIDDAWDDVPDMPSAYVDALDDAAASLFVPWFYPDEPDCRGMATWYRCDPATGGTIPTWLSAYHDGSDYTRLLDHPKGDESTGSSKSNSKNDPYWMWRYENAGFIRDKHYIDFRANKDATRWYHDYTLDWQAGWDRQASTIGGCDLTPKQKTFHKVPFINDDGDVEYKDVTGGDDTLQRKLVRRHGITAATDCQTMEYRMRQAYVGRWDTATSTYKGKYDKYKPNERFVYKKENNKDTWNSNDPVGPNLRCGSPILPLTIEKQDVSDYMDDLEAYGGTNSAIGMAWGWRMLTPAAPLKGASDPDTPEGQKWRKFVILMSDGKNNLNSRETPNLTTRSAYGYGFQDRLNLVTESNPDGDDVTEAYDEEIDHKTIRICHRMQAEGIKVFTVGYGLNKEKPERANAVRAMLKACANSAEGKEVIDSSGNPTGVTFIDAANPEQLQKAFEDITDTIEELHISG